MPFLPKEIRMKPEFIFGITDFNEKEDYSVWDNIEKKFIRDGEIVDIDGKVVPVQETRYIARAEFDRLFPNKGKKNAVHREVLIDGEIYTWAMPITVNTKLKALVATITGMGQDARTVQFKLLKTGTG